MGFFNTDFTVLLDFTCSGNSVFCLSAHFLFVFFFFELSLCFIACFIVSDCLFQHILCLSL